MKYWAFLAIGLLVIGCQMRPNTQLFVSDNTGERMYSRYFQNDEFPVEDLVQVDAIVSLGHERLPKGYKHEQKPYYSEGEVEAVLEFYFTNLTNEPVEIRIEDFECRLFPEAVNPTVMVIPPEGFEKSQPLISMTNNWAYSPWDYSMTIVVNGLQVRFEDKLVRLTVEQSRARRTHRKQTEL